MAKFELPPPELLRKLLRYEPDTGKLFWRERPLNLCRNSRSMNIFNTRLSGKEAFKTACNGYKQGTIWGVKYLAHRVIWAVVHGEWPASQIDHINGDRADNRIENLRAVSHADNGRNQKRPSDNTSGVIGVGWHKPLGKWRSNLRHKGRSIHLGYFTDFSEAVAARAAAEEKYRFHENHGRS